MTRRSTRSSPKEESPSASSPPTTSTESSATSAKPLALETPPANGSPAEPTNDHSEPADDSELPLAPGRVDPLVIDKDLEQLLWDITSAALRYSRGRASWDDVIFEVQRVLEIYPALKPE